ncbi:MAG TPA: hypothetical protein VFK78_09405 [Gemmatimonadales bacterium]|nr:hypothetical protein [Gemmatimonadales bacterium]
MHLTYDEAVHTYIGVTLITVAAVGAFLVDRPDAPRWRRHAWLGLALFLFWIVMGSKEGWTPPADQSVWWAPIQHLFTFSGTNDWWTGLASPHILQHKLAAICIVTPALTEWFIRSRPGHPASKYLQWVLPAALATIAVIFYLHKPVHGNAAAMAAMHMSPDPVAQHSERYQHWIFATAFLLAALAALTARLPRTSALVPHRAWYAFMAMGGLVFVTFRV